MLMQRQVEVLYGPCINGLHLNTSLKKCGPAEVRHMELNDSATGGLQETLHRPFQLKM